MSKIDESHGFLNKIELLQEKLRKSEEERLQLEAKFSLLMKSCKEEEEHRLHELRQQYENFLEEDKKRKERNKKILQTLERVESRAALLTAKSERLKLLREHYEAYLKRTYPMWKDKSMRPKLSVSQNMVLCGIGSDRPISTSQRNSFSFSDILPSSTPDSSRRLIHVAKEGGQTFYQTELESKSFQSPNREVKHFSWQSSFSKPAESSSLVDCIERAATVLKVDKDRLNEIYDSKEEYNTAKYQSPQFRKKYGILENLEKEQNTSRDLFNVSMSENRLGQSDITYNSNDTKKSVTTIESVNKDINKFSDLQRNEDGEKERINFLTLNDDTVLSPLQDNAGDLEECVKSPRKMYRGTACIDGYSDRKNDISNNSMISDALDPTHVGEEIERVLSLDNKDASIMKFENAVTKLGVIGEEEDRINESVSCPLGGSANEQHESTLVSTSGDNKIEFNTADDELHMNMALSANSDITFQEATHATQVQTVSENFPLHNSQEYYVEYESVQDLQQAVYYQNVVEESYEDLPIYDQNVQSVYDTQEFNNPDQLQGEIYSEQIVYGDSIQQNPVYGDNVYQEDFDTSQVVYEQYPQQEQVIFDQNQQHYDNVYDQNIESPGMTFEDVQQDQIMYEQSVDQSKVAYDQNMHPAQVIYQPVSPDQVIYQSDEVLYDDSLLSEQMMYNENLQGQHIVYTQNQEPVNIEQTDCKPEQPVNENSEQQDFNNQSSHVHKLQEEPISSDKLTKEKIYEEDIDHQALTSQNYQPEETNYINSYKSDIQGQNVEVKNFDGSDNLDDATKSYENEEGKIALTTSGIYQAEEAVKEEKLEKVAVTSSDLVREDLNEIGDQKKGSDNITIEQLGLNEQLDKDESFSEQESFEGGKYHERTVAYEGSNVCVTADDNSSEDTSERWSRLPSKVKPSTVSTTLNLEQLHPPDDDTSEDSSEQWGVLPSEQLLEKSQKESSVTKVKKTDVVQGKKLSRRAGVSKLPGLPRMPESDPESLQLDTDSSTTAD